jgi:DNA end-binding protein Ku
MARRAAKRSTAPKKTTRSTSATGGAGRGIWSGSISFGLLQIPVTLYTAESRAEEIHFRLLEKRTLEPIHFQRVSGKTGKPVEWKDIVKGYEIDKDEFVVVEPAELAKANVKATQTIDIQDFVPRDAIDPAYFETPYFVVPQARAAKAYVLLRRALEEKKAIAIATFVLRTREHLVALMPVGEALMLEVLRFGHELRDAEDVPLPSENDVPRVHPKELAMAEQLIEGMMTKWDPAKYKDRFHDEVIKLIEEKAKTGKIKPRHEEVPGEVANDVVDLLALLKKSVAANDDRPGPKKATTRKKKRSAA